MQVLTRPFLRRWQPGAGLLALLLPVALAAQPLGGTAGRPASAGPASSPWSFDARVQVDAARIDGVLTDSGRAASGTYLRRAEAGVSWRGPRGLEADLAVQEDGDGGLAVDEASLSWRLRGDAREGVELKAGRFDPDFGLDPSTSTSWTVLPERSPVFDLAPDVATHGEGLGLRADHWGAGHSASAGLYGADERDQLVMRGVMLGRGQGGAPGGGSAVWQAGASLALGWGLADDGRIRTRLGQRATTEFGEGRRSTLAGDLRQPDVYRRDLTVALEAAWQTGPWLLQAEWLQRQLDGAAAASRRASGQTIMLAWAFHGAPRRHEPRRARFGRPAGEAGRWGHLEAFARLDRLAVQGARGASATTVGLGWTDGRHWRAVAAWTLADSDRANRVGDTRGQGWLLRLQATL